MDDFTKQQINAEFKNIGIIENADYIFEYKSSYCGDRSKIYIKTKNDMIVDIKYEHLGCLLNCLIFEKIIEKSIGKSISFLKNQNFNNIRDLVIVPTSRNHCFDLAIDTITKGLNN